ncbi:Lipopolysaccharide core heptose(I) kinase RfaP [invertebrate metagenome]|uniref:Lipopolysaccharide core heptose(I) kinase RfaP n=1 Tax=invertebrate metagenome TaxID=1711999 RepID=A0A2H9T632_9ZZZZ
MTYLRDDLKQVWQGQDIHELLTRLDGVEYRKLEARRTFRFEINGQGFFAKVHHGIGWGEIIDNLIRGRKPVLGADNEWQALNRLHELGIDTMTPVAFDKKGLNPAQQHSYLVTEELKNMTSLEDVCKHWNNNPPPLPLKRAFIKKLATISRQLHDHGINHRDYYLCHFLMPNTLLTTDGQLRQDCSPDDLRFYLIDLHRAQLRETTPERWRIKDLSGLYYSAMECGLNHHDLLRFIRIYTQQPLKKTLAQNADFWQKVARKAEKLYVRMDRKLQQRSDK